jgi:hypothetical protein
MVPVVVLAGACLFGAIVNRHYPFRDWLFFRYAKVWVLVAYWFLGCASSGHLIVTRVAPRWRLAERAVVACAAGFFAFFLLMFIGGVLHLYRYWWFAPLLPGLMFAAGARSLWAHLRRAHLHLAAARRRATRRSSPLAVALSAAGVVQLVLLYLNILTPDNASFDAVYYHLGIAQQRHALGGIEPTPEGWIVDGLPALAPTTYAWGFIMPSNDLFDALMVCAHIEFVFFVATLASLPLLVRWLAPRSLPWAAWTALFLFPSIWVYDAGLHSGNDHIAAFWGVPIWLACRRSWGELEPRTVALFAVCAAAALMTKYQAVGLFAAPALALFGRGLVLCVRQKSVAPAKALGVALGVGLAATAPLWLKNWIWYGDPLFPALYRHVTPRPFHPHATQTLAQVSEQLLQPKGSALEKLGQMLRGTLQFPFRTRERPDFHKDWPIFGPLFHLSLLWLPFLGRARRPWLLAGSTFVGLFCWYSLSHQERYLQPLVPWMAAVAAASLLLAWRQRGRVTRVALSGLVALELVWGADTYFFPHVMLGDAPIRATATLLASGYRGDLASRERFAEPLKSIGEALPPSAKLLLHEHNPRIGLAAPVVMDMPQFQTGISYQDLRSPREVDALYRQFGVTHVAYQTGYALWVDNLAGDLRFWQFATHYTTNAKRYGGFTLAEMLPEPPDDPWRDRVLYLSCDPGYTTGLHPLSALGSDGPRPVRAEVPLASGKAALQKQAAEADFLVTSTTCKNKPPGALFRDFTKAARRGAEDLWVRKRETYKLNDAP